MAILEYVAVGLTAVSVIYLLRLFRKMKEMPPGPWGLPVIGYLPFVDTKVRLRQNLDGLAKKYGDIFSFRIGEHLIVALQSHDAISEAYSHDKLNERPDTMQIKLERYTGFAALFFGDERDRWSDYRKMATRVIGAWTKPHGREYLDDLLGACSSHYLGILEESEGEALDPMMTALSVVFPFYEVVTFGGKYDRNSKMIQAVNEFFENNSEVACNEFNMWIDHVPLLQLLKRNVGDGYVSVVKVFVDILSPPPNLEDRFGMVQQFQRLMESGQSFAQGLKIESLLMGVFLTAIDMATTVGWMFALLAKNPKVTGKLRRLITAIVADTEETGYSQQQAIENEPYVKATVYEVVRYSSECFGIPRCASEDVYFRGYLIPKGTILIGNTQAGNFDPTIFPQPEKFSPERFITEDGICDPALQAKVLTYSIGKRRCLGEALTTSMLSALLGNVIRKYDWDFGSGGDGAISKPIINGYSRMPGEHTMMFTRRK